MHKCYIWLQGSDDCIGPFYGKTYGLACDNAKNWATAQGLSRSDYIVAMNKPFWSSRPLQP